MKMDNTIYGWPTQTVLTLQKDGYLLVEDGNHGEYRPRQDEFVSNGVAFIRAADMEAGQVLFGSASHINDIAFKRIRKGIGAPQDIILSHKGTVGKLARVPLNSPLFVCSPQTTFWRVLSEEVLERDYLYYYMHSSEFTKQIWRYAGDTDMAPYLSLTNQRNLQIPLPPLEIQRAIAHILGTLDDKIELNRQMNQTLEEIARALFQSWFVDFDPVHAKARGEQPPGLDPAIADLFPDRFVETEMGLVPEGWRIGELQDLIYLQRGFDLPTRERVLGKYPILAASGPSGTHNEYKALGPGVVTGRSGVIGKVFYVHEDYWPLNTSLWVKEFRTALPLFAFHLLQTIDLTMLNAGSAVPTLNRNHVHNLPMIVPEQIVIHSYEEIVQPLFEQVYQNEKQSETLTELRDTLLPKLMSGELRVPETAEMVEKVAT